ncbi:MAG: hypothetical protein IPG45_22050 [Deltaproteobacteria bacterium]|jgi:hypothetical protein|nr:hypothetical protein [Deltaproteobacteria bacterium]
MRVRATAARIFDRLHAAYAGAGARRLTSAVLLATLVVSLLVIELAQRRWLPASLQAVVPTNHFVAVEWVVELLLLFEVIELIFGLAQSVAGALGKQLEVFSLILLRKSFEELKHFSEPIDLHDLASLASLTDTSLPLWNITADALGALVVFAGLVLFNRLQRHRPITTTDEELAQFIDGKKTIALLLLGLLAWLTTRELYQLVTTGDHFNLFAPLFTALIFSDIAIVFLSLRYNGDFRVVFRNFGFTVVTVFVRMAITAPPFARALMALGVVLYASALAYIYNASQPRPPEPSSGSMEKG